MLALCLNDTLEDALRQELLVPFVARLGGSADTPKIEMTRAEFMLRLAMAEILAPVLARAGFVEIAERCRSYRTPTELVEIARRMRDCDCSARHQSLTSALEHAADAGRQWLAGLPTEVAFCAFCAMREIASLDGDRLMEKVYRRAAVILGAALAIGNHAEPTGTEVVAIRMDVAKRAPEAADHGQAIAV